MKILILLPVFFTHLLFAATIEDPRGKLLVDVPAGWTYEQNLLGLPHVFLSSEKPEKTSVSLTLTGQEDVKLKVSDLKKNQTQYQEARRTWAQEREAKILSFDPYESLKFTNIQGHEVGVVYELGGKSYQEKSVFIECPQSLVHLKLLGLKNSPGVQEGIKLIRSAKCL
jgi:hypothetical protein